MLRFSRKIARAVAMAVVSILLPSAFAQSSNQTFFGGKEEGWFWYKDPKEAKIKPQTVPQPTKPNESQERSTSTDLQEKTPTFSVKWIRENLDKLRDVAIDDPSPDNVRAYFYAQRVMLDKADRFATAAKQVVLTDPLLDENNRFPYATAARTNVLKLQGEAKREALKYLAGKAGLWFFFDSKCAYCSMQTNVVKHLAVDYGFTVKAISLDGKKLEGFDMPFVRDQGQFKTLNLTLTPTLVLAVPPKTFLVISQGVLAESDADERLLTAAASQKLLPEEISRQVDVFGNGVLSTEDMNNEEAKKLKDDPKAWVQYVQDRLRTKY